ncbi:hypothetical protein A2872_02685 [Candidatus Gottesmanbacteria bacterium RIFCSPHIGHO2_01_FULL_42_12]|uniref:Uncharacterized protein n=1 Tax=Candidatus Gottesmanbacteria bacterium RIFCSPHIGHO2_01_FULL_42_12 TaxID=1798377 RepID=A0A1F5Z182_9BACT|nr:MAG: hypothetical protein A2872_02685 [Candidatus Gottesmanbacteria bacterium RIFCSPHIGHO2_01_FULL_42_12]
MSQLTPIENETIRQKCSEAATACLGRFAPGGCPELTDRQRPDVQGRLTLSLITEAGSASLTTKCNGKRCLIRAACAVYKNGITAKITTK